LNACKTAQLGEQLHDGGRGVEAVLCWRGLVLNEAAEAFSTRFFAKVATGYHPEAAFEETKTELLAVQIVVSDDTHPPTSLAPWIIFCEPPTVPAPGPATYPIAAGEPVLFISSRMVAKR